MKNFNNKILIVFLSLAFGFLWGVCSLRAMDEHVEDVGCSICMDSLCGGQANMKLPCSHEFHVDCIYKWVNAAGNKTCPLCRKDCLEYVRTYAHKIIEFVTAAAIEQDYSTVIEILKQHEAIPDIFVTTVEAVLAIPAVGAAMQCQILAFLHEQIMKHGAAEYLRHSARYAVEKCSESAHTSVQLSILALLDTFLDVDYWSAPLVIAQEIAQNLSVSEDPRRAYSWDRFSEKIGLCNFVA